MPILLLLLVAMVVEITVLVLVGHAIGVLATILLLVLASVVGGWLLRREGTRTLAALQDALLARRVPQRELVDGMLLAGAGVLIVLPGFVSDVLALVLLFPPTRKLVAGRLIRRAERQVRTMRFSSFQPTQPDQAADTGYAHDGGFIVDSVVIEEDRS